MNTESIINALLGGSLIGVSAVLLMLMLGRISGINGITSGLLSLNLDRNDLWRVAFLAGLLIGPMVYMAVGGTMPEMVIEKGYSYLIAAGVLVGFGATLGSGCTSGHGVCGLARLSRRSLIATTVFLATAMITVFLNQ